MRLFKHICKLLGLSFVAFHVFSRLAHMMMKINFQFVVQAFGPTFPQKAKHVINDLELQFFFSDSTVLIY